jgi:hypothetical protein
MWIERSETMIKIWVLMLKSKQSTEPAATIWEGLTRVTRLMHEYIKDHYGPAAIEFDGKYYTPDCVIHHEPKMETAAQARKRILEERYAS